MKFPHNISKLNSRNGYRLDTQILAFLDKTILIRIIIIYFLTPMTKIYIIVQCYYMLIARDEDTPLITR